MVITISATLDDIQVAILAQYLWRQEWDIMNDWEYIKNHYENMIKQDGINIFTSYATNKRNELIAEQVQTENQEIINLVNNSITSTIE